MPEATAQSGLSDNAAGALAYVTIIPAVIFLIVEPYNRNSYIRFHSWQSIFLCVAAIAIDLVLGMVPIIGWILIPFFRWPSCVVLDHFDLEGAERRTFQAAGHWRLG